MRDINKTICNLIDKQSVAFIASVDDVGFPNIKAMLAPRKRNGITEFYFTTNTSSIRVKQYRENDKASIYFMDKRFFRGVQLIGTMKILDDEASKTMLWREGDEIYYNKGISDPDYCVLKFVAANGRYYHNFKSENFLCK